MQVAYRPLAAWPHGDTRQRRWHPFKASWPSTMSLLERELQKLSASNVVIGAGFRERDLRLDGLPRADAPEPRHPGIEISFDTPRFGRLVYATDACQHWQDNVRSIALGLESLRAVDRFGITRRGEQYAGWRQLAAGPATDYDLIERGRALIEEHGSVTDAIKATHPDTGGDPDDFRAVQAAREADA